MTAVDTSNQMSPEFIASATKSKLSSFYIKHSRVVWKRGNGVQDAENLLQEQYGQIILDGSIKTCVVSSTANEGGGILLYFGAEIHGYLEIFPGGCRNDGNWLARIRFGESVSGAMSELGETELHKTTMRFSSN